MIEFMDETELIAEFHEAGIWLDGEERVTSIQMSTVRTYTRMSLVGLGPDDSYVAKIDFLHKLYRNT